MIYPAAAIEATDNRRFIRFSIKTTTRRPSATTRSALQYVLISTILACLLSPALLVAAQPADTSNRNALEYFFHQSFNNLSEELEVAREESKKGLFVMFNDPNCPWCAKMKATVMNKITVQEFYRKHFRVLHIDTLGDTPLTDFQGNEMSEKDFSFKVHRVRATPVFIFFDLNGKQMLRYTGATRNIEEFMWLGEYIISDAYKKMKFTKYKRKKRSEASTKSSKLPATQGAGAS